MSKPNYSNYANYINGGISGLAETIVTYPIDTIKTQIQSGKKINFSSSRHLFRGFGIKASSTIPMRLIFWGVRDQSLNNGHSPIVAGSIAGFFQSVIDSPFEKYKIQQQLGNNIKVIDSFRNFSKNFLVTSVRNVPFCAIFSFLQYNKLIPNSNDTINAGFSAGCAALLTQPLDTIKTRYQSQQNSTDLFKLKGIMKGTILRLSITTINLSVAFSVYSLLAKVRQNASSRKS